MSRNRRFLLWGAALAAIAAALWLGVSFNSAHGPSAPAPISRLVSVLPVFSDRDLSARTQPSSNPSFTFSITISLSDENSAKMPFEVLRAGKRIGQGTVSNLRPNGLAEGHMVTENGEFPAVGDEVRFAK